VNSLSLDAAKRALVDEEPATGRPPSPGEWIAQHPAAALVAAAGAGVVLAMFPRVRKVALPLAVAVIKHSLL